MQFIKNLFDFYFKFNIQVGMIIEIFIVLILGFGIFIYSSTVSIIQHSHSHPSQTYNSYDFIFIIIYEIIALMIIGYYLKKRNWKFQDFNLDFTFKMIGIAILLVLTREVLGAVIVSAFRSLGILSPEIINSPIILFQTNIFSILLITVVNSIYEEVILIGYLFKRLEKLHFSFIIIISFVIRASFHTYQGWDNIPMVFILALVFGVYYARYRKLMPLILAHAIGNSFHFFNEYYHLI
jgi:membrane protease YdiL (CAAX protease family)